MIWTIIGAIAGSLVIGTMLAIVALEVVSRRRWRRAIDTMNLAAARAVLTEERETPHERKQRDANSQL